MRNLRAAVLALKSRLHLADPLCMRWLGISLVALTLIFSTGGVAVVGQADPGTAADAVQGQCPAPVRRAGKAKPTHVRTAPDNKSIVLNTSGYNYPLEGEWHPNPVERPQGLPEGTLPEPLENAPGAPAKK